MDYSCRFFSLRSNIVLISLLDILTVFGWVGQSSVKNLSFSDKLVKLGHSDDNWSKAAVLCVENLTQPTKKCFSSSTGGGVGKEDDAKLGGGTVGTCSLVNWSNRSCPTTLFNPKEITASSESSQSGPLVTIPYQVQVGFSRKARLIQF